MNRMETVEAEWERFRTKCLVPDTTPGKVRALKHAFYAGVSVTLLGFSEVTRGMGEDEAIEWLNGRERECLQFAMAVIEGRA